MAVRAGVLLSGCGVFDGSEIHEAVSILIALDRRGAQVICMAPNLSAPATNHLAKQPEPHPRNVLQESARIARGKIRDLATVKATDLDVLVLPGGFGAAKNLSTFAADGANCRVNDQVERLIREMHSAGKPIGLACIAPVIAARVLGALGKNPKVTLGADKGPADAVVSMKAQHESVGPTDICIDETNRLVSTPCYMNQVGPWTVFQGVEKLIEEVLRMAGAR